jgi:hypothetical protein
MRTLIPLLFAALLASGQPTNLRVVESSIQNIGAALCYVGEDAETSYHVKVSLLEDLSVLVHDVNPALFANSDLDLERTNPQTGLVDTTVNAETLERCVQIGHTGDYFPALDGSRRDRVLETLRTYHWSVEGVAGDPFTTLNIPLSIGITQSFPAHHPFDYGTFPTLNPNYQKGFRDPFTGMYIGLIQDWGNGWDAWTTDAGTTFDIAESADGCVASSGTLADAIDTDDGIYAQCATNGEILFIGLGSVDNSKIPQSSSGYPALMSFQNVLIKGDCNGSGCGAGVDVEIALTHDRGLTVDSAWKTFRLTTTEAEIRICHPEQVSPDCSTPDDPGDLWVFGAGPPNALGKGTIWTDGTCPGSSTVCFNVQEDCENLRVNDRIRWYVGGPINPVVTGLHCESTPPYVDINGDFEAWINGSDGVPWRYDTGIDRNSRYGFAIRKKNAVADATIRIDTARWVSGMQIFHNDCGFGAGGMNTRFQAAGLTTPDNFLFANCNAGFYTLKTGEDGDLQKRFMGFGRIPVPGGGSRLFTPGPEVFPWSTTEAGVFYYSLTSNSQISPVTGQLARYLLRVEFNHPDIECGQPGTTCVIPAIGFEQRADADLTVTNMTPCNGLCETEADDYTLDAQILRLVPEENYVQVIFGDVTGVLGDSAILMGRQGTADSFGFLYAFDLGGAGTQGTDYVSQFGGGSQRLYAYNATFENPGGRWDGLHTFQDPKGPGELFAISESAASHAMRLSTGLVGSLPACTLNGDCGACPNVTIDNEVFTSSVQRCSVMTITSGWDMAWEPQPALFEPGDPVNIGHCDHCPANFHWLQKLAVGDMMGMGVNTSGEFIKLLQKNSNEEWVVARGCWYDGSPGQAGVPKSWSDGEEVYTFSNDLHPCTQGHFAEGLIWNYTVDHNGSDSRVTDFVNHAFFHGNIRMNTLWRYEYLSNPGDWEEAKVPSAPRPYGNPSVWAGENGLNVEPGCVERHPSFANFDGQIGYKEAAWDVHPLSCTGQSWTRTHVTGDLYSYVQSGSDPPPFLPKHYPLYAFQARYAYQHVDTITGGFFDRGKWCWAVAVNDCFAGSSANTFYANGPVQTYSGETCNSLESYGGQTDFCTGNHSGIAATGATQHRVPVNNTDDLANQEEFVRNLHRDTHFRGPNTMNVKPHTTGRFVFFRGETTGFPGTYGKVPPFPDPTAVNRNTFIPRAVTIAPEDVPMGTAKMQLYGGYDEGFRCTSNTDHACVVISPTMDEADPFQFDAEVDGMDGIDCASGCTAYFPQVEGRVLRVQARFFNAGGSAIGSSAVSFELGAVGGIGGPRIFGAPAIGGNLRTN